MESLRRIIKGKKIEDIYLTGFVDIENGIAQFFYDLRYMYFEINSKYIEFESINQFSKLRIKVVDSVQYSYEMDEDMMRAKTSISEIILNDTMANGNDINNIIFYNMVKGDELICDAVEIELVNGQVIFLDPSYYFGINIGGIEQKQIWEINFKEVKVDKTRISVTNK